MTATVTTARPAPGTTPTIRQAVRRWRFWAIVLAVLVVVTVLTALVAVAGNSTQTFDPANAGPKGGRALAEVLRQQGVAVTVTGSIDTAASASGTLLVDDANDLLTADDWSRLLDRGRRLVVVGPDTTALSTVLPGATAAGQPRRQLVSAGCGLGLAARAGTMSLRDVDRNLRAPGATTCFGGQLVTASVDGTRVLLLADEQPFTNDHITEAGNAAVALNVLGALPTLTWLRPDPLQADGGARSLADVTPPWVTPAIALLLLAGVAAALQRGRRLGPIVVERLPVVVRSRETVEGRARLYARGGARLRAADSLRIGAIGRIAPMLGLARSAALDEVVSAAAVRTGRHRDALRELLVDRAPADDRALVQLSDDLARLEAAVRAASVPGATPNGDR